MKKISLPVLTGCILAMGVWLLPSTAAGAAEFREAEKVAEVLSGERNTADASWWGFDEEDSTEYLLQALDSGASTVIVPNMGKDWVIRPISLPRDNQEIIFEEGVVVSAKRGEFLDPAESLFSIRRPRKNIALRGYGATLRMWKEDYVNDPYPPGAHRHVINVHRSENVQITGLTLKNSGGDGIYIRAKNIVVKDVVADGNLRQGISVTCGENILIEDTILRNTAGSNPQSGIDLEPNRHTDKMVNVVIRNTIAENNAGRGFIVSLGPLNSKSEPVSIRFENCEARNNLEGISVMRFWDVGVEGSVKGLVEFVDTISEHNRLSELAVRNKSAKAATSRFVNCVFRGGAEGNGILYFHLDERYHRPTRAYTLGALEFKDCVVEAHGQRLFAEITEGVVYRGGVQDIKGDITFKSANPGKNISRELLDTLSRAGLNVSLKETESGMP